ncbi:hypothetical protein AO896_25630 [Pseudomonas aeruginosa]|uniref:Uncharacterized protein n=1 Tax=Pseudomonas paraeruginosa (strain DSM 24068 / PA7) TaxID=381754 RepID=A6V4L1_PSEP7|nr:MULTISPECIES: hypothetical protein [Pseudomonas aeruginosa group]ABR86100.2 hypothetical protein PSPA7_2635 [Pseudomonas aeruginosa PA7]KSC82098.1 hypothetical protein AO896_25630 [Pseudomonas aeruginosa]KSD14272.1 hypothetical protein AO898_25640 [Pseudomonas aeruginosa]KSG43788.1 hypothetical protein AO955_26290 [Pseudomonas aeruginosa]MCW8359814.1 hypothetical protein [Pseudomonas aeruginosa]
MVSRRKAARRRETLFTTGLNPCIGVLLWDDNWIVLGHLQDSSRGSFEKSYQAVLEKMRADSAGSSVVYGGIAYHRHYDDSSIDHRETLRNFLRLNGVVVQTDSVGSNEDADSPSLRVAISRSSKYLHPQIRTALKRSAERFPDDAVPKPLQVARSGQYAGRVPLNGAPAIALVSGQNTVETFDYGNFTDKMKKNARYAL